MVMMAELLKALLAIATVTMALIAGVFASQGRDLKLRGGRFAALTWQQMDPAQKAMVDALLAGPRKSLDGPFNAMLRSPKLGNLAQQLGEYLRFETSVPKRLNEMAILMTAQTWGADYEWYLHRSSALAAGLDEAVVDDILEGRRPASMRPDENVIYDFCAELRARHRVSDKAFKAVRDLLGEPGVLDLIGTMGYYDFVSMVLNIDVPLTRWRRACIPADIGKSMTAAGAGSSIANSAFPLEKADTDCVAQRRRSGTSDAKNQP